mmetsp:Transcript_10443/g.36689  ORF Transcript_10443/g.36689 Transcript_10443/m.36689 type:complete len:204 (+) Transcript_10443:2111-2722(+)
MLVDQAAEVATPLLLVHTIHCRMITNSLVRVLGCSWEEVRLIDVCNLQAVRELVEHPVRLSNLPRVELLVGLHGDDASEAIAGIPNALQGQEKEPEIPCRHHDVSAVGVDCQSRRIQAARAQRLLARRSGTCHTAVPIFLLLRGHRPLYGCTVKICFGLVHLVAIHSGQILELVIGVVLHPFQTILWHVDRFRLGNQPAGHSE